MMMMMMMVVNRAARTEYEKENETRKKKKKKKTKYATKKVYVEKKSKRSYHEMSYPCCLRYGFIEKGGGKRMKMSLRIR